MLKNAQNAHYRKMQADWETAHRMYTGDFSPSSLLPRGPFESRLNYDKRLRLADFRRHTALLIGRLTGGLFRRSGDVERTTGEIPAGWFRAAGPAGESYELQLRELSDFLLLFNECWLWVQPRGESARLHVVSPLQVPRWKGEKVIMLGQASKPNTPIDEPEETDTTYTIHTPTGWTTYMIQKTKAGKEERVQIDSGTYADDRFFVDSEGRPRPPIFRVTMPWDSPFGVSVAKSHQQMYKMTNELDMGATSGLNSSISTVTGVSSDGEEAIVKSLKQGHQLIFLPDEAEMKPYEQATGNLEAAEQRVKAKKKELYRTAYSSLEESTRMSATQSAIENAQGPAAALAVLASVMQSAETEILQTVQQALNIMDFGGANPQDPAIDIEWPDDFASINLDPQGE